jgi:hypothetical protein
VRIPLAVIGVVVRLVPVIAMPVGLTVVVTRMLRIRPPTCL